MSNTGYSVSQRRIGPRVYAGTALTVLLSFASAAHAQTGTITGRVTNVATNGAIAGAFVNLCSSSACTSYVTNGTGTYTATVPLGSYTLWTEATGFASEAFDDVPCLVACDANTLNLGTAIVVTAGVTLTRNIALFPEGRITGVVVDAVTRVPIPQALVELNRRVNGVTQRLRVSTDAAGVYTVRQLGPGTYNAHVSDSSSARRHVSQIFGGLPCIVFCSPVVAIDSGAPIVVTAGGVTTGIDFALDQGASISGTVRRQGTTTPLAGLPVRADVRVGSQLIAAGNAQTDAAGAYVITGLIAGTYVAYVEGGLSVGQVHDTVRCVTSCTLAERATGRPIAVTTGGATPGIDFNLPAGGTITGRVTEGNTPLANATVLAVAVVGTSVQTTPSVVTDAAGLYSVPALATGSYVVAAQKTGYTDEMFGGVQMPAFSAAVMLGGTRVPVTDGFTTANINVALDRTPTIMGRVRVGGSPPPPGSDVVLFQGGATPQRLRTVGTDSAGNYKIDSFPGGTYFVATSSPTFDNQAFSGVACPAGECTAAFVAASGTPVVVAGGATVTNIDLVMTPSTSIPAAPFSLQARNVSGGVEFSWRQSTQRAPATSFILEAGLAPGATIASVPAAGTSLIVPGVPPGTYFLRVRGVTAAGAGPASNEVTLRVDPSGVVLPNAPGSIQPVVMDGALMLTWASPGLGPVPTGFIVEAGTAVGRSDIGVLPVPGHLFRFNGVPPGVYFVRLRSVVGAAVGPPSADVMMVVGNAPSPPSEPSGLSATVAGRALTFQWTAPLFGTPTDYVIEAGSQPGAADLGVVRLGSTAVTLTVPNVPPGRYFVRLRATNALGSSPPSNEREVIVP